MSIKIPVIDIWISYKFNLYMSMLYTSWLFLEKSLGNSSTTILYPLQWGFGLLNWNIITSILLTITKISLKASHVHILFRRLSTHPNLINTEIKKLTHPFLLDDSKTCHACGGEGWCGDVDGRGVDWLVKIFFILIKK